MKPPLYSIVIPTRERPDVLASCLKTVQRQTACNFEAVVMDNFGGPETRAVVEALNDPRVRYHRAPRRLSMSENWEMGLDITRGDYVMFLGDDDGMLPDCVEIATLIHRRHPEMALGWNASLWYWPEVYPEEIRGRIRARFSATLEWRDIREWLGKVGRYERGYSELPGIYTSFLPRHLIDAVKARCGSYFASPIPDVWSAVINCLEIDRYLFLKRPLSFRAVSHHSTGHSQLYHKACSKAAKRFKNENSERWDQQLDERLVEGPIFEADMLIADTILKAMAHSPDESIPNLFSFKKFANRLARGPLQRHHEIYDDAVAVIRKLAEKNGVADEDLNIPSPEEIDRIGDRQLVMKVQRQPDSDDIYIQMNTHGHLIRNVADACVYLSSLIPTPNEVLSQAVKK